MFRNLVLCALVSVICGCTSSASGLKRTYLEKWERKEYQTLGISIEVPEDSIFPILSEKKTEYVSGTMRICLHPENYGYVEPHYVIVFGICILTKEQYENYTKGKTYLSQTGYYYSDTTFFSELKEDFHPEGTPKDRHYYRKDYKNLDSGKVILATAVYWEGIDKDPQHKPIDIEAIKRILHSIKFIDDKAVSDDKKK